MKRRDWSSTKKSPVSAKIPRGAIAANQEKLVTCSGFPEFPLWYVDKPFACADCGKREVWTAGQQQWWHEVAGGKIESTAIRCWDCRAARRKRGAADNERLQAHRKARAQEKAAELSAKLALQGPEAFDVLERPVDTLVLSQGVLETLRQRGVLTLGDVVSLDPHSFLAGLRPEDRQMLKRALWETGLSMTGAPVARPEKP